MASSVRDWPRHSRSERLATGTAGGCSLVGTQQTGGRIGLHCGVRQELCPWTGKRIPTRTAAPPGEKTTWGASCITPASRTFPTTPTTSRQMAAADGRAGIATRFPTAAAGPPIRLGHIRRHHRHGDTPMDARPFDGPAGEHRVLHGLEVVPGDPTPPSSDACCVWTAFRGRSSVCCIAKVALRHFCGILEDRSSYRGPPCSGLLKTSLSQMSLDHDASEVRQPARAQVPASRGPRGSDMLLELDTIAPRHDLRMDVARPVPDAVVGWRFGQHARSEDHTGRAVQKRGPCRSRRRDGIFVSCGPQEHEDIRRRLTCQQCGKRAARPLVQVAVPKGPRRALLDNLQGAIHAGVRLVERLGESVTTEKPCPRLRYSDERLPAPCRPVAVGRRRAQSARRVRLRRVWISTDGDR